MLAHRSATSLIPSSADEIACEPSSPQWWHCLALPSRIHAVELEDVLRLKARLQELQGYPEKCCKANVNETTTTNCYSNHETQRLLSPHENFVWKLSFVVQNVIFCKFLKHVLWGCLIPIPPTENSCFKYEFEVQSKNIILEHLKGSSAASFFHPAVHCC